MLNIILKDEYFIIKEKYKNEEVVNNEVDIKWDIFNLLKNEIIMKGFLSNNMGGEKTKDGIKKINDYFKDNKIMQSAKKMNDNLSAHNISMLIKEISKNWDNYFKNKSTWFSKGKASNLTGCPLYPKPKKLSKVNKFAIQLESTKFSLKKKNILGLTFFRKQIQTRFLPNQYVNSKTIKSLNVSYSNGSIYYNFGYEVSKKLIKENNKRALRKIKPAGLDIGIINLASIVVHYHLHSKCDCKW
jgi:hypothetical protein